MYYTWRCEHARFCVEGFYALYINFHSFIHVCVCVCVWGGGVGGINCPGLSTMPLRMMRVRTVCVCGGGLEVETAQDRPLHH